MYSVCKEFTFDAAHRLPCLEKGHPCRNIHGHTYRVGVKFEAKKLNSAGMILDFRNFSFIKKFIDETLDHTLLIDDFDAALIEAAIGLGTKHTILPVSAITCENLSKYLCEWAAEEVKSTLWVDKENENLSKFKLTVFVSETPKTTASYTIKHNSKKLSKKK